MKKQEYKIITLIIVMILCIVSGLTVVKGLFYVPLILLPVAMVILVLLRTRVVDVIEDERIMLPASPHSWPLKYSEPWALWQPLSSSD
jgi:uncharacterized membrane protein